MIIEPAEASCSCASGLGVFKRLVGLDAVCYAIVAPSSHANPVCPSECSVRAT